MILSVFQFIERKYWLFFILGIVVALWVPRTVQGLNAYLLWFIGGILFLSYLKIDYQEMKSLTRKPWFIGYLVVAKLLIIPTVLYFVTSLVYPSMAIPVLILSAMPAGMSSPAFTKIINGNVSLSLVIVVLSTMLVPIVAPTLFRLLGGTSVSFALDEMIWSLVLIVFIPLFLAVMFRFIGRSVISNAEKHFGGITILLIVLSIMGPLAANADYLINNVSTLILGTVFLCIISIGLHYVGWIAPLKHGASERKAYAVCCAYMNFGLAIAVSSRFFGPEVLIGVLLYELPWDLMLVPFKMITDRIQ